MTMIDQRILIPAGPDIIWALLSDLSRNPAWQADCRSIAFLTSLREGPGTRWRSTHANGQETVQEISAWYDGLGYEYTYVDGAPYRESKGRIRLQEIAEGTVVQWTFTYEMPGVIGGLRNSLGVKRQIEAMMIDSLKSLWRQINQAGGAKQLHEPKSLMRDALDYQQRAQYKPRHKLVGKGQAEAPTTPPVAQALVISEPPISDEDTKPRPSIALPKEQPIPTNSKDPDFLFRPAALQQSDAPPVAVDVPMPPTVTPTGWLEPDDAPIASPPVKRPEPVSEPKLSTAEMRAILDTSDMDTGKVSIWEVFGVPRPSETQQMRAVQAEQEAAEKAKAVTETPAVGDVPVATPSVEEEVVASSPSDITPTVQTPNVAAPLELPTFVFPMSTEPPKIPDYAPLDVVQERPPEDSTTVEATATPAVEQAVVAAQASSVQATTATSVGLGLRVLQRRELVKLRRHRP
jgi:uncharacterized membrane protein